MESLENWINPLAGFTELSQHPSVISDDESPLSSAPPTPGTLDDLKPRALEHLHKYQPIGLLDDTEKVLEAFIENLSGDGQLTILEEIQQFGEDPPKLRALRNFLVDAILKPSTFVLFSELGNLLITL
jgi:hypothetical protein